MKKFIFTLVLVLFLNISLNIDTGICQWVPLGGSLGGDVMKLEVFNGNIYAGGASIFRSTNAGNNWTSHMPIPSYSWSIAVSGTNIYCGVWSGTMNVTPGVYKSTNNGLNFSIIGLNNNNISDIVADNQRVLACAFVNNDIYLSTNQGANWTNIKGSLGLGVYNVGMTGNRIYAGAQGLHMTTNNGASWTAVFMTDNIGSLSVTDSMILIGTYSNGVYRSTNYGQSWTQSLNINKRVISVYQYGNYAFAGVDSGFYVSTNRGVSFVEKSQGLNNASVTSTLINGNYIYVSNGSYLNGNTSVYRRLLSEVIGITNISTEIPSSYSLGQNYPNPFNSSSKFKFEISKLSDVKIIVYDVMGREVQTLVNETLKPGTYEATFDGSQLTSGVYFYKLITDGFTETKRMLMIK